MAAINDKVQTGETVCAVLRRDGKIINVVEGKSPKDVAEEKLTAGEWLAKQKSDADLAAGLAAPIAAVVGATPGAGAKKQPEPDRYEITLVIRDRITGESRKYEVQG